MTKLSDLARVVNITVIRGESIVYCISFWAQLYRIPQSFANLLLRTPRSINISCVCYDLTFDSILSCLTVSVGVVKLRSTTELKKTKGTSKRVSLEPGNLCREDKKRL